MAESLFSVPPRQATAHSTIGSWRADKPLTASEARERSCLTLSGGVAGLRGREQLHQSAARPVQRRAAFSVDLSTNPNGCLVPSMSMSMSMSIAERDHAQVLGDVHAVDHQRDQARSVRSRASRSASAVSAPVPCRVAVRSRWPQAAAMSASISWAITCSPAPTARASRPLAHGTTFGLWRSASRSSAVSEGRPGGSDGLPKRVGGRQMWWCRPWAGAFSVISRRFSPRFRHDVPDPAVLMGPGCLAKPAIR